MKKVLSGLRYAFYALTHPIQGFYEMRFEGRGSLPACLILLALLVAASVCQQLYAGFIFNTTDVKSFNVLRQIANVLIPVLLWCVANWSITVLMDGEGRFRDIFMATCYASMPYTLATLACVVMSRFIVAEEATFMGLVSGIGLTVTALLLFFGILTIHQFTVKKTVGAIVVTVLGMVFIVFLAVLFASVFDKLYRYIAGIVTELKLRM